MRNQQCGNRPNCGYLITPGGSARHIHPCQDFALLPFFLGVLMMNLSSTTLTTPTSLTAGGKKHGHDSRLGFGPRSLEVVCLACQSVRQNGLQRLLNEGSQFFEIRPDSVPTINIRLISGSLLGSGSRTRQTQSQRNPNSMHLLSFVILLIFYKNFLYQFWIQCNPPSPNNLPLRSLATLRLSHLRLRPEHLRLFRTPTDRQRLQTFKEESCRISRSWDRWNSTSGRELVD